MSKKVLKLVDAKGRVVLGSSFYNQLVEIEELDGKLIITKVETVPATDIEEFKKWKKEQKHEPRKT